jgi:sialidase-1
VQVLIPGQMKEAIMNPCPVIDRTNGAIVLFCISAHNIQQGRHRHLITTSNDDGKTWSKVVDVGGQITPYDDTFVSGPGVGIQTGTGRLVIPGYTGKYNSETRTGFYSRVLYSDDHARTWKLGQPVSVFTNECQVVELENGRLMLNMRENTGKSCRAVAISEDGGRTWAEPYWDRALNECPCQASLIRYTSRKGDEKSRLLFANPDIVGQRYGVVPRTRMTIKLSYDEGKTWPVEKLIHPGPSSYSSLVRLPGGDVGLVYEGGEKHRREWIRFARISLPWLTDGRDRLSTADSFSP